MLRPALPTGLNSTKDSYFSFIERVYIKFLQIGKILIVKKVLNNDAFISLVIPVANFASYVLN